MRRFEFYEYRNKSLPGGWNLKRSLGAGALDLETPAAFVGGGSTDHFLFPRTALGGQDASPSPADQTGEASLCQPSQYLPRLTFLCNERASHAVPFFARIHIFLPSWEKEGGTREASATVSMRTYPYLLAYRYYPLASITPIH